MKKFIVLVAGLLVLGTVGWYLYTSYFSLHTSSPADSYVTSALTKVYQNMTYRFSLKMPENFEAREFEGAEGGQTVVLEDPHASSSEPVGIQIAISPAPEGLEDVTQDVIKESLPDLQIRDAQPVEVGAHKGLAFKSDNDAFNGDSREVWFVYNGNLYQISTYARLDELLKQMFTTWQFN